MKLKTHIKGDFALRDILNIDVTDRVLAELHNAIDNTNGDTDGMCTVTYPIAEGTRTVTFVWIVD